MNIKVKTLAMAAIFEHICLKVAAIAGVLILFSLSAQCWGNLVCMNKIKSA
jgi:hypothetical protein